MNFFIHVIRSPKIVPFGSRGLTVRGASPASAPLRGARGRYLGVLRIPRPEKSNIRLCVSQCWLLSAPQPRRNVYSYYCKDNGTANQALNAFRILLSQLLEDHKDLRPDFDSWVQEQKKHGKHPTSDPSRLKDLLIDLVAKLQEPTFFIIDALDECLLSDQGVLLGFLEGVCSPTTSTRVLTSARAASDLGWSNDLVPRGAVPIRSWKLTPPRRDRDIAKFLVNLYMPRVSEEARQLLENELASRMEGCAIWARMTLEYLGPGRCASVVTLQSYLEKNELPGDLTDLYLGVYENMTRGDRVAKWLLARSLELIAGAGAGRRLTFDELLYALGLYTPPSKDGVSRTAKDLAELRRNLSKELNGTWIRHLLRPFTYLEPRVGLVHQSLKETVLEFPALTAASRQQGWTGISGIEGTMLRTCIDYLLLDDFNWTEAIPDDKGGRGEISQVHQEMRDVHGKMLNVLPPFNDKSGFIGDERCSPFSGYSLTEPPVSSNTDPFGAFFNYAACCWRNHLDGAPVNFSLDDVLELASPTSARYLAWALESGWYPRAGSSDFIPMLNFFVHYGNVSMLEQLLDRLALDGDGDRRSIVDAAKTAIRRGSPSHFRALMNHPSTAMAMQTVEMLEDFVGHWWGLLGRSRDDLKEWTKLITDLFDALASDTISSPNYLILKACGDKCMPAIEKICERAKADPAFQEQLMQLIPTDEIGLLGVAVQTGNIEILRYLCQQDGIEAHASDRNILGRNILAYCCRFNPKMEIIEVLLDRFPWLVSERRGGDKALIEIIKCASRESESVKTAKFLLQHTQATPGLVDVDELLTEAVRGGWPDMCQMLIVDGHADARTVVKRSSSGRLELKEHCLEDRWGRPHREPDEKVVEAIAGCLPEEVLQGITAAQENEDE